MQTRMWMVRSGRGAILAEEFESRGYVAIGWNYIADISHVRTRQELEPLVVAAYPGGKEAALRASLGQLARFRFEMRPGDWVLTYNPEARYYLVGTITSEYLYQSESPQNFNHMRKVEWKHKVARDALSVSTRNSLGSAMTLFLVPEAAQREVLDRATGVAAPEETTSAPAGAEPDVSALREDMKARAHEFIKDRLLQLDWEEMQELAAGILRAMGYKTRVSSPGPDRGTDIVASPDGLGLEQPRIRVEVKHRQGSIGASEIRSFAGGLRTSDRGLYVSSGGFTKEAKYEADRSTVAITLLDLDALTDLVTDYYDQLDADTRALIPLLKVYWPV